MPPDVRRGLPRRSRRKKYWALPLGWAWPINEGAARTTGPALNQAENNDEAKPRLTSGGKAETKKNVEVMRGLALWAQAVGTFWFAVPARTGSVFLIRGSEARE